MVIATVLEACSSLINLKGIWTSGATLVLHIYCEYYDSQEHNVYLIGYADSIMRQGNWNPCKLSISKYCWTFSRGQFKDLPSAIMDDRYN